HPRPRSPLFPSTTLFRSGGLGAVDASYEALRLDNAQIVRFTEPNAFGNVDVNQAALGYRRSFDLYPMFDLLIAGGYRRVDRVGRSEEHTSELQSQSNLVC